MAANNLEINELARGLVASQSILTSKEGITGASGIVQHVYYEVADHIISVLPTEELVLTKLATLYWQSHLKANFVAGVPRGMDAVTSALKHYLRLGQLKTNPEIKDHGTKKAVDGIGFQEGDKVAVFEDVIVTGGSTIRKSILPLQQAGLEVVGCFALISKPWGGVENIARETGVPVFAYTKDLPLLQSIVRQRLMANEPEKLEIIEAEIDRQQRLKERT